MSERTAKVVLLTVALLAMWGIVTVLPETAYVVVGILGCLGWQRVGRWIGKRRDRREDEDQEEPPDVAEALRLLGQHGDHVLLTQLRKRLGVADTKAVRALLKESGIRVRSGVRTPAGNGPGVHRDDIPQAPPPREKGPVGGPCRCSSEPTTPTPTTELRVEPIGLAGAVVHDPAEAVRRHRIQ